MKTIIKNILISLVVAVSIFLFIGCEKSTVEPENKPDVIVVDLGVASYQSFTYSVYNTIDREYRIEVKSFYINNSNKEVVLPIKLIKGDDLRIVSSNSMPNNVARDIRVELKASPSFRVEHNAPQIKTHDYGYSYYFIQNINIR